MLNYFLNRYFSLSILSKLPVSTQFILILNTHRFFCEHLYACAGGKPLVWDKTLPCIDNDHMALHVYAQKLESSENLFRPSSTYFITLCLQRYALTHSLNERNTNKKIQFIYWELSWLTITEIGQLYQDFNRLKLYVFWIWMGLRMEKS